MPAPKYPLKREEWKRKLRNYTGEKSSMYGKKHTKETREKMSDACMGEKNHNFGKKLSEDTCKKMSESRTGEKHFRFGKHLSDDAKNHLSNIMTGIGNPGYGLTRSRETCLKISNSKIGKPRSEETRKKLSESNIGHKPTEESRMKQSMSHMGITDIKDWNGYASKQSYCGIFTPEFKMRQYEVTGYKCLICGEILDHPECHHVYWQKSSCCQNVDESGELYFNIFGEKVNPEILLISDKEKELEYGLNKFATLCSSCHGKVKGSKNGKSRIDYIREIENIINTQYNGRSYYTKEEYWGNGYYHKQDGVEKFHDAITGELYGKYLKGFNGWGIPKKR